MTSTYHDTEIADNKLQISRYLLCAARARHVAERNQCRPSVQLLAELSSYSDVHGRIWWQASYGGLIETGCTPDEAFAAFDRAWNGDFRDD